MREVDQHFQADDRGLVWTEELCFGANGGPLRQRFFRRRDGLRVMYDRPSGATDLDINKRRVEDGVRGPDFWMKDTPDGVRFLTVLELDKLQKIHSAMSGPTKDVRRRLINYIDEKWPEGSVE